MSHCKNRQLFRWEVDGLVYRTAVPEDAEAVWKLMTQDFYPRTALCQCLGLNKPEDFEASYGLIPHIMDEGVSLVVEDAVTKQLIGARLSSVEYRDQGSQKHPLVSDAALAAKYQKYSCIYKMFDQLTSMVDFYERYGVSKLLTFKFLVVRESHSGRGIARKLVECTMEMARELKLELLTVFTASKYSERIYDSMKWDRLGELRIPDFVDPGTGEKPFESLNTEALTNAVLYAKKL